MTEAAVAEAQHDGPREPAVTTPPRAAASVRRVTVVDILRPVLAATPRVLPWAECPRAAASAGRPRGQSLLDVREDVRAGFIGRTTRTHLNDQLRSLADVVELARECGPPN